MLAFDDALHLLYVASESGIVSIFKEQGRTLKKVAEGHLADKAHSVTVDEQTHRVYFPVQNLNGRAVLRIMEPIAKNWGFRVTGIRVTDSGSREGVTNDV